MVDVYQVDIDKISMKVWVDPKENLPVQIEYSLIFEVTSVTVLVMEQMQWDKAMPDSLFALDVPPGYTEEHLDSNVTEESLTALMRICAEMADGIFPNDIEPLTVLNLFRESKLYNLQIITIEDISISEMDDHTKKAYRKCFRGLAFISQCKKNGSWQYAGKDVKRGDKHTPLCWWKPSDSEMFRAMFGDLQIRDVPSEQLPQSGASESDSK